MGEALYCASACPAREEGAPSLGRAGGGYLLMTNIKESYIIYFLRIYYIMANPFSTTSLFPNKEKSIDGEALPNFSDKIGYHFRFTCNGELQTEILDFMLRNSTGEFICARENGTENGREHIQGYCEFVMTKKSFMNKFNEKFKKRLETRDKYLDKDKGRTRSYVCKGVEPQMPYSEQNPHILSKRALTGTIEYYYTDYWANVTNNGHEKIQLRIVNLEENSQVPTLKKDKKKPTFMAQCRIELEEEYPHLEWSKEHKVIVFKKIMSNLGQGCKALDHIILTRMTYGVLNSLIKDKQDWLEYWFYKSFSEIYPHTAEIEYQLDE